MHRVLLLGAGFSHNWGGPLASEMYGRLIGRKPITDNPELHQLLNMHRDRGGFEAALGALQADYQRDGSARNLERLKAFQGALAEVFSEFDSALTERPEFEFQNDMRCLVRTFMVQFDSIFSLNQDLLLERHYLDGNVSLSSKGKWSGWQFPGMQQQPPTQSGLPDVSLDRWMPSSEYAAPKNQQPVYKMHGSVNWFDAESNEIMVVGHNKVRTIHSLEILTRYLDEFEAAITKPDTRLVIIGYGFADEHVNNAIRNRIRANNLKIFIIDPLGADVCDPNRNAQIRPHNEFLDIVGGESRRPLRQTFGGDVAEHRNVMGFIS